MRLSASISTLLSICLTGLLIPASAEDRFDTGAILLGGDLAERETSVRLGPDGTEVQGTGGEAGADGVPGAPGDSTQAAETYAKINGQPINTPANLEGLPNVVGTDFAPTVNTTAYNYNGSVINGTTNFDPGSLIRFTPLELAQVNDVRGYLGTASRNGVDIDGPDGNPQEIFVPASSLNANYMHGDVADALDVYIPGGNHQFDNDHHHDGACDENCTHPSHLPYPDDIVEQRVVPRVNGYLRGCQVLGLPEGVGLENQTQLQTCIHSIQEAVASVSRDEDGGINRVAWMCNVMAQLNPKEQEFAAMVFTAGVEAGQVATSPQTPAQPGGWRETLFVQQVIQNRTNQLRADLGQEYNAMDTVLAHMQFSMYNASEFDKFRSYFEPDSNRGRPQLHAAVRSFIELNQENNRPASDRLLQPRPQIERMSMYYSPAGMRPRNRVPSWVNNEVDLVENLNFAGRPVRTNSNGVGNHRFYSDLRGPLFYASSADVCPRRGLTDAQCRARRIPQEYRNCEGGPTNARGWLQCRRNRCGGDKTAPTVEYPSDTGPSPVDLDTETPQ